MFCSIPSWLGEDRLMVKLEVEEDDNMPVIRTPLGRIGGLICWESEFCLSKTFLPVEIHLGTVYG